MRTLSRTIGLFACRLDWHRRPLEKEPRPRGVTPEQHQFHSRYYVTPEQHQFHSRYYCPRCGLVGRVDAHGNLDPGRAGRSAKEAW